MSNSYVNDFTPSMRKYHNALRDCKPITKDAERDLILLAKNGDLNARNAIVTANLRFVWQIASRYKGKGADMEDLVSEGNLGLLHAIEKFDLSKDAKLTTYAVWWIKYYITEFIEKRQQSIINERDDEVLSSRTNSVHGCNDEEDENVTVGETVMSSESYDEMNEREKNYKDIVNRILPVLNDRERVIVASYYGIGEKDTKNLEDISKVFKISKERVRQIKEAAMRKLRSEVLVNSFSL